MLESASSRKWLTDQLGWVNTGCPGSGKFISTKEGTVNVGITGSGTIDGSGLREFNASRPLPWLTGAVYMKSSEFALDSYDPYRPFLLFLVGVKGVTIRDVTLKDSAFWNLRVSA
jgi:polygalacturonase